MKNNLYYIGWGCLVVVGLLVMVGIPQNVSLSSQFAMYKLPNVTAMLPYSLVVPETNQQMIWRYSKEIFGALDKILGFITSAYSLYKLFRHKKKVTNEI